MSVCIVPNFLEGALWAGDQGVKVGKVSLFFINYSSNRNITVGLAHQVLQSGFVYRLSVKKI